MTDTRLKTMTTPLIPLYNADQTTASIAPPTPTIVKPAGGGIIAWSDSNEGWAGNLLALLFYGVGSSGQTATARVTGWRQVTVGSTTLWVPTPLLSLNLTHGSQTGVAGAPVLNTENFVTTITAATAYTSQFELISPGDGSPAVVKVDGFGSDLVQVQLAIGSDTSINGLWGQF